MKKFLVLSMLSLSVSAAAADLEKYCLPFLNGDLEGQGDKPALMEEFTAVKAKMVIAGSEVQTIDIVPKELESKGNTKTTSYPWGEESEMSIMKYKKNGKQVRDYKLIVSRDKSGNLISVAKKPVLLQDFKFKADTIYFKPQNETCIPEKFIGNNKLKFSVDLCREIDRFLAENPTAKECLLSRHDQKLASLVREHAKAMKEKVILSLEKVSEDRSAIYAADHRVDCSDHGLDGILSDKSLWEDYKGKRGELKVSDEASKQ